MTQLSSDALEGAHTKEKGEIKTTQDNKRPAWYTETISKIPPEAQDLLENYSGIPSDEIIHHVKQLQDKAFDIFPYACIGQLRFLTPSLSSLPFYPRVLNALRNGANFLDAGCCFGQELRYLVHREGDGIQDQLYGFDLEDRFTELGYELFKDKGKLTATFVNGDILADPCDSEAGNLDSIIGQMDIIFASSFMHVWDWDEQKRVAYRLVTFLSPWPGSSIVGRQMGSRNAGSYPMPTKSGSHYRHNEESMKKFWEEVGMRITGTKWKVNVGLYDGDELKENRAHDWSDPDMCMIWWEAIWE